MATETLTIRLDAADVREIVRQELAKVSDELQTVIMGCADGGFTWDNALRCAADAVRDKLAAIKP